MISHNSTSANKQETAVLVALITQDQPKEKTQEYLAELSFLAFTLGIKTLTTFTQYLDLSLIHI